MLYDDPRVRRGMLRQKQEGISIRSLEPEVESRDLVSWHNEWHSSC